MAGMRRIAKSAAEIVAVSFCTILLAVSVPIMLLFGLLFLTGPAAGPDWTSVDTGQEALGRIESERSGYVPELASDFYYWDQGFLSDHTTYWSFNCTSLAECKLAAAPVRSSFHSGPVLTDAEFREWTIPEYDFIVSGPGYFGKQHSSEKWDVSGIRHGTSAIRIDYNSPDSELQFSAIDFDALRVYRLRWYGSSLTSKLKDIGDNHAAENNLQGKEDLR